MHLELSASHRAKLDAIVAELRADPRVEGLAKKLSRQDAARYAINAYTAKGASGA